MKRTIFFLLLAFSAGLAANAQTRRPIDSRHPAWMIHVDVWNKADPQKIIDLIPAEIKPYAIINLSLSCQYDVDKGVYKMPQNAVETYKSWGSVCCANNMWFTCQPASGGHTHIMDDDMATFEFFFKHYPNFLGWNYAEQFWGFDEAGDKSSSSQASRWALFARLVEMSHKYGGFLTVSFCGNIWSHPLNANGRMALNKDLREACQKYPEAYLELYKYTQSACFLNNESVTLAPFISGLAKNYGIRYDNCGWNATTETLVGKDKCKYPVAAGIGTTLEQTCINGGAVWDGPELIWTEDIRNLSDTQVDGYTRRNWGTFPGFRNAWMDMFRKILDGTMYIPTRQEVIKRNQVVIINNQSGDDATKYAAPKYLYDGLYKQDDPMNPNGGYWMDQHLYLKRTGRYQTIPVVLGLYDSLAQTIPVQVKRTTYDSRWGTLSKKVNEFNSLYPEISTGNLFVARNKNELVTYFPYSYLGTRTTAQGIVPLQYNTCDTLTMTWGRLSSAIVREYADHINFYLNNYRTDTTAQVAEQIVIKGATSEPTYTLARRENATATVATPQWDAATGTYVFEVKHLGPVDLTITCAGAATGRSTDMLPDSPLSADLPKQPDDFYGNLTIEAEDMDYKSIKSCVTDPYTWYPNVRGHAGNGFADMGTSTAGSLRHNAQIRHEGKYAFAVRYTCTSKDGKISVNVNGKTQVVNTPKTQSNEWLKAKVDVDLVKGANKVILTNIGGSAMYIDNISYIPYDKHGMNDNYTVTIEPAEGGTAAADVTEGEEDTEVTLTSKPQEGFVFDGWEVAQGRATIRDNKFALMSDVVIRPLFRDAAATYKLDFSNVISGTLPVGWQATQEDNTLHAYPTSYSQGARSFTGFKGYQGAALYWRNVSAEYGRQTSYPLALEARSYNVTFAMAAWKGSPTYKAVVESLDGKTVLARSEEYTASPNANGSTTADISSAAEHTLPVTVTTPGNYVIRFECTSTSGSFSEFLLAECNVRADLADGLSPDLTFSSSEGDGNIYDISGRKVASSGSYHPALKPGIYIRNKHKYVVRSGAVGF
jgi:hypothetical protein